MNKNKIHIYKKIILFSYPISIIIKIVFNTFLTLLQYLVSFKEPNNIMTYLDLVFQDLKIDNISLIVISIIIYCILSIYLEMKENLQ